MEVLRLTQFSPGAGCGCKISPAQLKEIISTHGHHSVFPGLLVGNDSSDDAAVMDLGNGTAIVSTTDFFTPIVDDPYDFGRIAATNAISDIYAMGGTPLMAIAILGWPLEKLPTETAGIVLEGARKVCNDAGIPLAGGHSIDIADPVFGLAVTGIVKIENLKQNSTASPGCILYLTKPIGVGMVTTAEKRGLAREEDRLKALELMTSLNIAGSVFGGHTYVKAMTDVTGFGLAGHLLEICEGSGCDAELNWSMVPRISDLTHYIGLKTIPGGTHRNFKSYGERIGDMTSEQKLILCDPQTSGGLLVAVEANHLEDFEKMSLKNEISAVRIGRMIPTRNETIRVWLKN